jgi:alpha-glucosidase
MQDKDAAAQPQPFWWQHGVVYQVYPRSFQDADGDGVGDLPGLITRLDYLKWLGVDAVWLSPIYPSPMADFGYDVADYQAIAPMFGSMNDFDALVRELHARQLKLVLDFVPNHSSSEHPWFVESCRDRSSPKRNRYIWRDPAPGGGPPNNWLSEFGGSAWTYHAPTGQYYYHAYLPQQPDLNWRNPEVESAMHAVLRFWLDRGVDGFRVDAIHMLVEDESLADNPPNPLWRAGMSPARSLLRVHSSDRPETHELIARMRRVVNEYDERVLIGEAYLPIDRLMLYYGKGLEGFHLPFNFHLISTPWQPRAVAQLVREYERALPQGGWPTWVMGNHDKSRVVTRLGGIKEARLAALLLLTLRGTPTLYNGEEIGMRDVPIPPGLVQDPWEKRLPGLGLGRDPCRTPFQWSAAHGAGFTQGTPWLPIAEDFADCNAERQMNDSASMLTLYRDLLRLRRAEPALSIGRYREMHVSDHIFVYERAIADRSLTVAMNFSSATAEVSLQPAHELLLSTSGRPLPMRPCRRIELQPLEGIIALASSTPTFAA